MRDDWTGSWYGDYRSNSLGAVHGGEQTMKSDRRTALQHRCAKIVMHVCETDSDLFFRVSDYWMRGEKRIKDFAAYLRKMYKEPTDADIRHEIERFYGDEE